MSTIQKFQIKTIQVKKVAIKNGAGNVTGYLTMYWSKVAGWVSIPGGAK